MFNKFQKLSIIKKKVIFAIGFVLSIPAGALVGGFLGLVATTFIPVCCNDTGCHSCFEFKEMVGYQATAYIGFWLGIFIVPILYILLVKLFINKESL